VRRDSCVRSSPPTSSASPPDSSPAPLRRTHHLADTSGKNLGNVLTLWDRLRGTFESGEATHPDDLGVAGEPATYPQGWWRRFLQPLRWSPKLGREPQPDLRRVWNRPPGPASAE
jgi:hypothetical protein